MLSNRTHRPTSIVSMLRLVAVSLSLVLCSNVLADAVIPQGSEMQVNTYTTGNQGLPQVASDAQGNTVVVWEGSNDQDGSSWGIFGQRFGIDGQPEGAEFQVNSYTLDLQVDPQVDRSPQGDFVVVWMSYMQTGGDVFDIFAQRYDASGTALGGELQVNTFTTGYQGNPDVALDDAGNFLVVWESETQDGSLKGVYGQRFDNSGAPAGDEFLVNTTFASDQNDPVAVATDGNFLVAWEDEGFDGSSETVVMQAFDGAGTPLGGEVQVNTFTTGDQEDPSIAVGADGSFAIAWESDGQDGSDEGIFAQLFDASRQPLGDEVQVNLHTPFNQENPAIAADGQGGFYVVWQSEQQADVDSFDDIYGRRLDGQGNALGTELLINGEIVDDQDHPAIGSGNGQFLVAWRSFGGHDGSAAGAFGQRLALSLFADGFESGSTEGWSGSTP